MSVLGFIPARSGSKGVINKNIKLLNNIPLLAYSLYIAQLCKSQGILSEVLVSTDSKEYLNCLSPLQYSTDYVRPSKLATDDSPTIDAVKDAIIYFQQKNIFFQYVIILQPTSPFRNINQIKDSIDLFTNNPLATCVASVYKLSDHHPRRIKTINQDGFLEDFCKEFPEPEPSRRQDFIPEAFIRSGSIYLSRVQQIMDEGIIRGQNVLPIEMTQLTSINIDEELDFYQAEALIQSGNYYSELKVFKELEKIYEA